jgi:hypothetical protein
MRTYIQRAVLVVPIIFVTPSFGAGASVEELIQLAQSAAPPSISKDATVLVPGQDGNLVEAKKGSNGFTCLPDLPETPKRDPMRLRPAATQWAMSLLKGEAKPSNTRPGTVPSRWPRRKF